MHVIATAGHVDHGKSTLVRALTGMEPDRWAEERRRGMTIDLGFAWTDLPSGARLAFVDVPGHERFIANMLAGVGPVPAVMLVIAADDGWRPQTEEHVAALDALGVGHGLLVITRSDLADPRPALADATQRLSRTSLAGIPSVTVSGRTGSGLDELRTALDRLVAALPAPDEQAPVRLWIDRSFTIRGAGTVVTGTLGAGRIAVGDVLQVASTGDRLTVRGMESCKERIDVATSVARVALNLRGVATDRIGRGDALVSPDTWRATSLVDVRVTAAAPSGRFVLHVGSAAVGVRVRPLGGDDTMHARLTLSAPLPLHIGDRCLIRDPSRSTSLVGARVMDVDPTRLHGRGAAARRATALASAADPPTVDDLVRWHGAIRVATLRRIGVVGDPDIARRAGDWLVAPDTWNSWKDALHRELAADTDPLSPGRTPSSLAHALALPDQHLLDELLRGVDVAPGTARIRLRTEAPQWDESVEAALGDVEAGLRADEFTPPTATELAARGLDRRVLAAVVRTKRLDRIAPDVYLLPGSAERAAQRLARLPQPFTVADARQGLASTRRIVVPLLEHLDACGYTRRVDTDHRVVVRTPGASPGQ